MKKTLLVCAAVMMSLAAMANLQSLKLVNNQLCTADNNPVQLRGWSTNELKIFRDGKLYNAQGAQVNEWVECN